MSDESLKVDFQIPEVLYYGTYQPLIKTIMREGLLEGRDAYFLKLFPEIAENDAEIPIYPDGSSREIPPEWLDHIVILEVDIRGLDPALLDPDPQFNLQPGDPVEAFVYSGRIAPSLIKYYSSL